MRSQSLATDVLAGIIASLVTIAHCLSFSALIFSGELASGLPMAVWGFMVATALVTLMTGALTSLPPILAGPRNPAVAVMAVMASGIGAAAAARGLTAEDAARHVLIALSIAGFATGLAMWLLGTFRLGQVVRYVPYPVIGGFLGASGLLLVLGGLRVAAGAVPAQADLGGLLQSGVLARLVVGLGFAALLIAIRRSVAGARLLPLAIIGAAAGLEFAIWAIGGAVGWHLETGGGVAAWSPLALIGPVDWRLVAGAGVEILTIAGVSIAALMLDVSSLEVQRRGEADMDGEFRSNGAANMAVAAVGGLSVGHALNPSRLIDQLGGGGRIAGLAGGLFVGAVLATGIDIAALVPRPILGGLLVFLGAGVLADAIQAPGRRARPELALTVLIIAAIVVLGYLTGLLLGVLGACLLFAARYSRIDAVRRHATRLALAAPVERDVEENRLLRNEGGRLHVFWLSGYLFFGSSNGAYERIRETIGDAASGSDVGPRYVVLDGAGVSGIDASAVLALQKLGNWAVQRHIVVVFAGLPGHVSEELTAAGVVGGRRAARAHPTRAEALEWCENRIIAEARQSGRLAGGVGRPIEAWLGAELGDAGARRLIDGFLVRRQLAPGEVVCAVGAPSDTIEIVVQGAVSVMVQGLGGETIPVRRMARGTIVGEMGFFRGLPRAASVVADGEASILVMTREAYERMRREAPELAALFLELVVRLLADRLEAANREVTVLG